MRISSRWNMAEERTHILLSDCLYKKPNSNNRCRWNGFVFGENQHMMEHKHQARCKPIAANLSMNEVLSLRQLLERKMWSKFCISCVMNFLLSPEFGPCSLVCLVYDWLSVFVCCMRLIRIAQEIVCVFIFFCCRFFFFFFFFIVVFFLFFNEWEENVWCTHPIVVSSHLSN